MVQSRSAVNLSNLASWLIQPSYNGDDNKSPNSSRSRIRHAGFIIVPQQSAFVIERLGRFKTVLSPGFHLLIPIIDKIAYIHSLKEEAINVANQSAITRDNVSIKRIIKC